MDIVKGIFNFVCGAITDILHACMITLALIAIIGSPAHGAEFLGSDVGVFLASEHITHGHDAWQLGITLRWDHVKFDASHGIKRTKWRTPSEPQWKMDEWQSGSSFALRYYPFNMETIRPMVIWNHSSDITRGKPFNDKNEPTSDFFGAGFTFEKRQFELDLAYGRLGRECRVIQCAPGSKTNEFMFTLRGYFK